MSPTSFPSAIVVRPANAADAATVRRLAILDSAPELSGDVLLAVVDGHPVAALETIDGRVVSDPFEPTEVAAALLREYAHGLRTGRVRSTRRRRPLRLRRLAAT